MNIVKHKFLGMNYGTAANRLRKMIMFELVRKCEMDICFRCNKRIEKLSEFSIEHKEPWLYKSRRLFWDLRNIVFSHLSCNVRAIRRKRSAHGTKNRYNKGCKCLHCTKANTVHVDKQRLLHGRKKY